MLGLTVARADVTDKPWGGGHANWHSVDSGKSRCVGRRPASGCGADAHRLGVVHGRADDGRSAGQRQESGLDHHRHRRIRRQGPLQLPGGAASSPVVMRSSIRAIGYKLDGPKTAEVAAGATATADLKLSTVKSLVPQLSSAEWFIQRCPASRSRRRSSPCASAATPCSGADVEPHARPSSSRSFMRMGALFAGLDADASAAACCPDRAASGRAVTGEAAKAAARISRQPEPRQRRFHRIRIQDAAAAEGPRHARHRHRVRPAAQGSDAARRDCRCRRPGLVLGLRAISSSACSIPRPAT